MKTKSSIEQFAKLTEFRARARDRANSIAARIQALEGAKPERLTSEPQDRIRALLDGESSRTEALEITELREELATLEQYLRDSAALVAQVHNAASGEFCEQLVHGAYRRMEKQVAAMRMLRDLNAEADSDRWRVLGAGYELAGNLRIVQFLGDQLDGLIAEAERDIELYKIRTAPDTPEQLDCRVLVDQFIDARHVVIGDIVALPAKTARTLALQHSVEIVTPEAKQAANRMQRLARLSEVTA